ncbi:hypothetical protein IJG14_05825 [bacterium]|nr:hypothetical protein [bacterium]
MPQPTNGENSAYTWTTDDNGQVYVTVGDKTYYTDIKQSNSTSKTLNYSYSNNKINVTNTDETPFSSISQTKDGNNSYNGDFIGNNNSNSYGGGAIYINSNINSITGNYIGNYSSQHGGGICHYGGNIESIVGDFIGNYANNIAGGLENQATIGSV